MRKLGLIYSFLNIIKGFVGIGGIVAIVIITMLPNGTFIDIGDPYYKVEEHGKSTTSSEIDNAVGEILSPGMRNEDPIVLQVKSIDLSTEINYSWKTLIVVFIIMTAAFFVIILHSMQRIIKDIKNGKPFSIKNIQRLRTIGLLVMIAPIVEWLMSMIMILWFSSLDTVDGLKLEFTSELGWMVFILGLIIYTLGFAFEEGNKIVEEQELTI